MNFRRQSLTEREACALASNPSRGPACALAQEDKRDMLHAVYRVGNMDATIQYYKTHFGAKVLRYRDIPEVRRRCRRSCCLIRLYPNLS